MANFGMGQPVWAAKPDTAGGVSGMLLRHGDAFGILYALLVGLGLQLREPDEDALARLEADPVLAQEADADHTWAEAVQITRVSPIEISAEPVAVRTKPGSIVVGRIAPAGRA